MDTVLPELNTANQIKIIHVCGTSHSGTTLLQLLLSSPNDIFGGIHLVNAPMLYSKPNLKCINGESIENSRFWNKVKRMVESQVGFALEQSGIQSTEVLKAFFTAILKVSEAKGIVQGDNSLDGWYLKLIKQITHPFVIHIVRDARAVYYSNVIRKNKPELASKFVKWWNKNLLFWKSYKDDPSYCLVRYEDLVNRPREVVSQVLTKAAIFFNEPTFAMIPQGDAFYNTKTNASYAFSGNHMMHTEKLEIEKDAKYLEELDSETWNWLTSKLYAALNNFGYLKSEGLLKVNIEKSNQSVKLRWLPYPFRSHVAYASDCDKQSASHCYYIHNFFNQKLGLPISNSLWVQSKEKQFGFFQNYHTLNDGNSQIESHTTYGLLLRLWHRGYIDHLHSWYSDTTYTLLEELKPPLCLSVDSVDVKITPIADKAIRKLYGVVRIYILSNTKPELSIRLTDKNNNYLKYNIQKENWSEISEGQLWAEVMIPYEREKFDSSLLRGVRLSLQAGADKVQLLKIERSNFCRKIVLKQKGFLEKSHIFPFLLTSHGGLTCAQNFGNPYSIASWKSPPKGITMAQTDVCPMANIEGSYGYHVDILYDLGLTAVWPLFPGNREFTCRFSDRPLDYYVKQYDRDFYAAIRTVKNSQGYGLHELVEEDINSANKQQSFKRLWYTHFGTVRKLETDTFKIGPETPFTPEIMEKFRLFTDYYYNISGNINDRQRVLVSPASTFVRYEIVRQAIELHTKKEGNKIFIYSWIDDITDRLMCDPKCGTLDLHGITFYIDDPEQAIVYLGDTKRTDFFTKNQPDETGQSSITLVDDQTPTILFDQIPLEENGVITAHHCHFHYKTLTAGMSLVIAPNQQSQSAYLEHTPEYLPLWNTTHIYLSYRKLSLSSKKFSVAFILYMANGHTVIIREATFKSESLPQGDAFWEIDSGKLDCHVTQTLATTQLFFVNKNTDIVSLPIGKVKSWKVVFDNVESGDCLELDSLMALRPSNSILSNTQHQKCLGGRVYFSNKYAANINVYMDGKIESTDDFGYYVFSKVPRRSIVSIYVEKEGKRYFPRQGKRIDASRDDFELDIFLP